MIKQNLQAQVRWTMFLQFRFVKGFVIFEVITLYSENTPPKRISTTKLLARRYKIGLCINLLLIYRKFFFFVTLKDKYF